MNNKNQFRSVLIAKRISYAGIYISIGILIVCIITSSIVVNLDFYRKGIYGGPPLPSRINPQEIFFSQVFPSMIISGISGLIIFLPLNHIFNHKLKNLGPVSYEKELRINQTFESFKFKRIQEYGYLF